MKNVELNTNFWRNLNSMKIEFFPDLTWQEICKKSGVNSATFRSSKCNNSLPSSQNMMKIAKFFETSPDVLMYGTTDKLATRRKLVADSIINIDEQTFFLVERMLGLEPINKQK